MRELSRRALLTGVALAPLAGAAIGGDPRSSRWKAPVPPREALRESKFPNVPLTTHEGKKVFFYDDLLKDKVVTINFMYTQCRDLCPLSTANLAKVQKLLGDKVGREIFMYSFTLDPEHDTPQVLKAFAEKFQIGPGWSFLTGKYEHLELLRRRLGFVDPDPKVDKDRTNHIGTIEYGNEPLTLWSACPSMAHAEWIVKEISWVINPEDRVRKS
jgi:protein SCO1/2